jgi:hypothetical protein
VLFPAVFGLKSLFPIKSSDRPCLEKWTEPRVHFRKGNMRSIKIKSGDLLVLYAVGGPKRVFALAEVTSNVCKSGREDWPYQVAVKYSVNVPVRSGVPIEEVRMPRGRDLLRSLRQSSYIKLTPEEYDRAATRLRAKQ